MSGLEVGIANAGEDASGADVTVDGAGVIGITEPRAPRPFDPLVSDVREISKA